MRKGVLVAGIVLLVLGAVLWYLPIPMSQSQTVPTGYAWTLSTSPAAAVLTPTIPYSVTWDASPGLSVSVFDCGSGSCDLGSLSDVVTSGSGGSLSWSGVKGSTYAIVPTSNATFTVSISEPLGGGDVGVALLVIGGVLLIVGAATGGEKPRPAPVAVQLPTSEPSAPSAPAASP
ncbi:MAG: hypothetical protein ACREC5_04765 [Thermoplasmata archaeon]